VKKIQAFAEKEDNKPLRILSREGFKASFDGLPKGRYRITVEKYVRKASTSQFGYLYSTVYPLALVALNDAGYEFTNTDDVDMFFKALFANREILNRETGVIMNMPMTKSQFTTIDEMTYTNSIRDYVSEYLGAFIPEADPDYKLKNKTE